MDWVSVLCMIFIGCLITFVVFMNTVWSRESKALDKKYNVSKFPITSLMGNQYFAEIKYNHESMCWTQFTCNIYERVLKKSGKLKDILVASRGFDFIDTNNSHIGVVKNTIKQYEDENLKVEQNEDNVAANKKLFEAWDGIIKEEED